MLRRVGGGGGTACAGQGVQSSWIHSWTGMENLEGQVLRKGPRAQGGAGIHWRARRALGAGLSCKSMESDLQIFLNRHKCPAARWRAWGRKI